MENNTVFNWDNIENNTLNQLKSEARLLSIDIPARCTKKQLISIIHHHRNDLEEPDFVPILSSSNKHEQITPPSKKDLNLETISKTIPSTTPTYFLKFKPKKADESVMCFSSSNDPKEEIKKVDIDYSPIREASPSIEEKILRTEYPINTKDVSTSPFVEKESRFTNWHAFFWSFILGFITMVLLNI